MRTVQPFDAYHMYGITDEIRGTFQRFDIRNEKTMLKTDIRVFITRRRIVMLLVFEKTNIAYNMLSSYKISDFTGTVVIYYLAGEDQTVQRVFILA